jgi:DUF1016 N-terminal domain
MSNSNHPLQAEGMTAIPHPLILRISRATPCGRSWDVGQMIHQRQQQDGWGTGVIPRLSRDLRNELPELKGFSERNIGYMIRFAREYDVFVILQQPVAKLAESAESSAIIPQSSCPRIVQDLLAQIPWGHNILLMEKFKDLP